MATESYTVRLEAFEGPLDLLLYLIRKAEVDIHDIPIGTITEQFLAFLSEIDRIDMDAAGEFLLMAATLMEIKSRSLSPEATDEGGAREGGSSVEDPRRELVAQLLEYRRLRASADDLEARFESWRGRRPAAAAKIAQQEADEDADAEVELEDLHLMDLVEAFHSIIEAVDFSRLGEHEIVADDTPMELHAADIVDRLERSVSEGRGPMPLAALFEGRRRGEMIGLFLATLELVRHRRVSVEQSGDGITLALREPDEAGDALLNADDAAP